MRSKRRQRLAGWDEIKRYVQGELHRERQRTKSQLEVRFLAQREVLEERMGSLDRQLEAVASELRRQLHPQVEAGNTEESNS
jgi:hypothetical protein